MTLGIPNTGSSGIIIALITFRKRKAGTGDYFIGTMILVITLVFSVAAVMQLYIIIQVRSGRKVSTEQNTFRSTSFIGKGIQMLKKSKVLQKMELVHKEI